MHLKIYRKLFHFALAGLFSFFIAFKFAFPLRFYLAFVFFVIMIVFEIFRRQRQHKEHFNQLWQEYIRKSEERRLTGAFWVTLGLVIVSPLPGKTILCLSVIYTGFADPMAEIIGKNLSLYTYQNRKTLGGSLGFFITSFILSFIYLKYLDPTFHLILISILGSLFATLIEAKDIFLSKYKLNDNLTILILTSLFLLLLFSILKLL